MVRTVGLTVNDLARMTHPVIGREPLRNHVKKMVAVVRDILQVDGAAARKVEGNRLTLLAAAGIPKGQLADEISVGSGISKLMLESRQAVVIPDVAEHPDTAHLADRARSNPAAFVFKSYAGVPLLIDGEVIGILGVYATDHMREFRTDEIDQLQVLANHIAASVVNERLYCELCERTDKLRSEIVERKLAEEKHKELEEQLRISQKMESLGRMAGGIAHDFNNLLTVMTAGVEFIELDVDTQSNFKNLKEAIRTASNLTGQLLAFSRHQPSRPRALNLGEHLTAAMPMLKSLVPLGVELIPDVESQDLVVEVDPTQLTQILLNLVTNATQAIQGSGFIRVGCRHRSGVAEGEELDGAWAELTVEDSGCGMPPEIAGQVFEPFYTTRGSNGGTGLGLSTVHGIVGQLGGQVVVESTPGSGSAFRVLFPQRSVGSDQRSWVESESVVPKRRIHRILLCEDNELVRSVLITSLQSEGYEVNAAGTVREALALAVQFKEEIDLLITDLDLPDQYGDHLVTRVREMRPEIPAMLITGYVPDASLERVREFDHVLRKPISRQQLLEAIASCQTPMR
ncbi:MAG TPA: ATP-binding protein [Phycisphaerae bacterium]|nr:ATP-binding protein [Phycisphaerae bacterium]